MDVILAEGLGKLISKKKLQIESSATELKHITKVILSKLICPVTDGVSPWDYFQEQVNHFKGD